MFSTNDIPKLPLTTKKTIGASLPVDIPAAASSEEKTKVEAWLDSDIMCRNEKVIWSAIPVVLLDFSGNDVCFLTS